MLLSQWEVRTPLVSTAPMLLSQWEATLAAPLVRTAPQLPRGFGPLAVSFRKAPRLRCSPCGASPNLTGVRLLGVLPIVLSLTIAGAACTLAFWWKSLGDREEFTTKMVLRGARSKMDCDGTARPQ